MYYYDSTDCLINSANRATANEPLSSETEQYRVDYFERQNPGCEDIYAAGRTRLVSLTFLRS